MDAALSRNRIAARALSRRSFLLASGGTAVAVAFGALPELALAAAGDGEFAVTAWVTIAADGTVAIMAPAAEMGQGAMTVLPLMIAEELDADWRQVRVVPAPSLPKIYGNPAWDGAMTTAGSGTVFGYWDKLRPAGALARKVLLAIAAAAWQVPAAELATRDGVVIHAKTGRTVDYGALAKDARLPDPLPALGTDDLKPASAYRLLGKDIPRVDVPAKVDGAAKYGQDADRPGMLYAAILHPEVQGEKAEKIEYGPARSVKGIVAITPMPFGVAVIARTVEGAMKAKALLNVRWTNIAAARKYRSADIAEEYRRIAADPAQPGVAMRATGDAAAALAGAAKIVSADYANDHVAHACMEPMNATALVQGRAVHIWASNQSPSIMQILAAYVVGTEPAKVTVETPFLGGGLGRRTEGAAVVEAVALAKLIPGTPVKVIWSREDDLRNDTFRPLAGQRIDVGLDARGNILGWRHRIVCASILARTAPDRLAKLGGRDVMAAGGGGIRYALPAQLVEYVRADRGIAVGAWRGIAAGYMVFAIETMIDELAAGKRADPVAYRLGLLKGDARAQAVVKAAAAMSGWRRRRLPAGHALGLAYSNCVRGYQSVVAEVAVDKASGAIAVHKLWGAVDCGRPLQPRNAAAQMEGAMLMGLGAALVEHVDIVDGVVQQANFDAYRVLRLADIPPVAVKLVASDDPPTGMGEAGIAAVAPAIANAVARLTGGKRLRDLPMLPARVKAALAG